MKVRYYGFMHPSSSISLEEIGSLIELTYGFDIKTPDTDIEPMPLLTCPHCGGKLEYRYYILPSQISGLIDTG